MEAPLEQVRADFNNPVIISKKRANEQALEPSAYANRQFEGLIDENGFEIQPQDYQPNQNRSMNNSSGMDDDSMVNKIIRGKANRMLFRNKNIIPLSPLSGRPNLI